LKGRVIISRHVTFTEDVFPENKNQINQESHNSTESESEHHENISESEYRLSEESDTSDSENYDSDYSQRLVSTENTDDDDFLSM
jgi:hypothetical protein